MIPMHIFRIQGGENWNYLMTDCMIKQQCIEVIESYNITYANATNPTLIWAGTYLDSVDDAVTLSLLPSEVQVGEVQVGEVHVEKIAFWNFCLGSMPPPHLHLLILIHSPLTVSSTAAAQHQSWLPYIL